MNLSNMWLNFLKEEKIDALTYKKVDADFFKGLRQYEWKYSVTSILGIVSNWEHLDKLFAWLSKEVSQKAMDNGTQLHEDVENTYISWKFILWSSNNKRSWMNFYTKEWSKWKVVFLEEKFIWDICWWTADALMEIDWELTMCDWKTAKVIPTWMMLQKYKLQLSIYTHMYEQKHWKEVKQWKIICFTPWLSYKIIELDRKELLKCRNQFIEVYEHFDNERKKCTF